MALALAVNPLPIIAVVLILSSTRARANGVAFVSGWLIALGVFGAIMLVLADAAHASDAGAPAAWVSWTKLVIGVALLGVAVQQFVNAGSGRGKEEPAWMGRLEAISAPKAFSLAVALGGINPKNLLLVAGGVAAIAETGVSGASQAVALVVFCAIASAGVLAPCVIALAAGERAPVLLGRLRSWLGRYSSVIVGVICLVIAVVLLVEAIGHLANA